MIGEAEIDEEHGVWWLRTFVRLNEEAHGPLAIGAEPPERFRQRKMEPRVVEPSDWADARQWRSRVVVRQAWLDHWCQVAKEPVLAP